MPRISCNLAAIPGFPRLFLPLPRLFFSRLQALALVLACASVHAASPLRLVHRTPTKAIVGNEGFSVEVHSSGRLEKLKGGDTVYVSFIALYTYPVSLTTGKAVRAVQGESSGRGIGPIPETMFIEKRGERYFISITRTAMRKEIRSGDPLYDLHQRIEIAPNGAVAIDYEFTWRSFHRVGSPTIYVALDADVFDGASFCSDYTTHCEQGRFTPGSQYSSFPGLKGQLRTLRTQTKTGTFDLWVNSKTHVNAVRWGKHHSIGLKVTPDRFVDSGTRAGVQFTIRIPLQRTARRREEK